MTTVALYARVSTKDKVQRSENQLPELRRFAQAYGYTIYKEYVKHKSGGTGRRSEFQTLFAEAHRCSHWQWRSLTMRVDRLSCWLISR
jgi:DNA invertase Pin-like site-specific DNA recombinase